MTTQTAITTDEVGGRLIEVLNSSDIDVPTALLALLGAMATVLVGIRCPDCRQTAANSTQQLLPKLIAEALKAPSERNHVH